MKSFPILCAALLVGLPAASAQTPLLCEHQNENSYCEIRELNLPFSGAVDVRTGGVGAIAVKAWDNAYVLARVHVNTSAGDEWQARAIAAAVQIDTSSDRIWASGPSGKSWAVSYEVFVPRECGLRLHTKVGAISLADVAGTIDVETSVGALTLAGLAGDVEAKTGVGAISVVLAGDRWDGKGLTATTNTGAIQITAATDYSARFDLRTALGGVSTNFPGARTQSTGFLGRKLAFQAGEGGARIQASTSIGQIELTVARRATADPE
jgi:hypothetical protein